MDANTSLSSSVQPTAQEVRSARAQLAAEERKLQLLLAKVEESRERIAAIKQVLAPIRRVPPEILGDIIALSATGPGAPAQVLRTLSSVCKFWRNTTLHNPNAWTKIHLKYETPTPSGPRTWLQTLPDVQEWFRRSGTSKKDVRVDVSDMPVEDLTALLDLIGAHSDQLRVLAMDSFPDGQLKLLEALLAKPMHCLEEWRLYGYNQPPFPQRAPALRRICASATQLDHMSPHERERLTCLGMSCHQPADITRFVDLCAHGGFPALRVLAIHDIDDFPLLPDDLSIALPALEAFHMQFAPEDVRRVTGLFSCLGMPNLATLSLRSELGTYEPASADYESSVLADMLHQLIDTSAPPLQRLYLNSVSLLPWELDTVMNRLPLLERLVLVYVPISSGGFNGYPRSRHYPRLTHVHIVPDVSDPEYSPLSVDEAASGFHRRTAEVATSDVAATKPIHMRLGHMCMEEIDGRAFWHLDLQQAALKHPRIFRDVYVPFDRWWHMDENILGSDLEGL